MRRSKLSLKARAFAYLARREHSYIELYRKLKLYAQENDQEDQLKILLDQLLKEGWLSNERFAESILNRKAHKFGQKRILNELKEHQMSSETLFLIKQKLEKTEFERLMVIWQKKFVKAPETAEQVQKQTRFLLMRGFSLQAINELFKKVASDDSF